MPCLGIFIQHSIGSLSQSNRQEIEVKGIQTGKEKLKTVTISDGILYIENPKDSTTQKAVRTNR